MLAIIVFKQTGRLLTPPLSAHRRRNSCQDLDVNYKSSFSHADNRVDNGSCIASPRFVLIATVASFMAANVFAQQEPPDAAPHSQPNAEPEEAAVRRLVDAIMQPYLAQKQRTAGGHEWIRAPHLGTIVAVSLRGHPYFFPYGKATDAGAPITRETMVEIGSCTKTFTTTLFALAIDRN